MGCYILFGLFFVSLLIVSLFYILKRTKFFQDDYNDLDEDELKKLL